MAFPITSGPVHIEEIIRDWDLRIILLLEKVDVIYMDVR